ncbi:hypothetical protein DWA12_07075 [Acinetobacter baumannii]|uniref:hypothetical protein n=1 Tax=Acinetobacter baumannii TaxID=470 RepID=UPI000DECD182|nr:hypothetical protein [Acinetobacter baumannii]MBF6951821.1 hypothetical protein [Acinetobacter baumannii]MBF6967109.1 hypothetical protein [Acinetobacter baumannii]MBF8382355.1 hypothetical protein [Acinetobacter baumannii]MBH8503853.1 hypothetical protein [Acinetobacter baumannii]MBJ3828341.1 hypothetical protein [Acinetobacter baumannii]
MTEVKFVSMPASELAQVIEKACENAVTKVLAAQEDELLTIKEICKRIPGLSYHTFVKLRKQYNIADINGKYSSKAVKALLQSHSK